MSIAQMDAEMNAAIASGRGGASRKKKSPESRTKRAGITFPVGRIQRQLKQGRYAPRLATGTPVYMAAVLEYLVAEVLELSGNCARDHKRKRITPRDILLSIRGDDELSAVTKDTIISDGGTMPNIHMALLPAWLSKKREEPTKTAIGNTTEH
jgi:histone H2A